MSLAEGALRAGYRLNRFERLGSTNDEAMRRALRGDRGRLWIVADVQEAGRGRHGRVWVSPAGNLYASLLLVDVATPGNGVQLGFVAGVALATALRKVFGSAPAACIKWPNDILAGDAKVAGILVEGSKLPSGAFATVIGFGVNCSTHPADTPYPATHLQAVFGPDATAARVLGGLSSAVLDALALWDGGRNFAAVRDAWLALALAPGTPMSVSARGGRRAGAFQTIDARGRLVLSGPAGAEVIDVGEIVSVAGPAPAG